ncbi:hypothetical protein AeRB84_017329 [Aphanomyces euteiches]|nr:hypothetical protein AeRB84_017329 [Aphanomyces euteiches]
MSTHLTRKVSTCRKSKVNAIHVFPAAASPGHALRSIRFGSFNARSLSSNIKQDQLATDATHYRVDIIGIQEALTVNMQRVLPEGYLLLTLPSTTKRLGTGFAVAPHLRKHLQSYWAHNERIAILQVNIARNHRLNIIRPTHGSTAR